ncbi:MAG: cytochrome ubiquinol oxidase subunit I, partial [Bacteroidales bacterium]|nr:cytochrome ubiquinol oxidase subunit I [Bacteroidales bacterium]
LAASLRARFEDQDFIDNYFNYFGFSYFDDPHDIIPNVPLSFYTFHIMVAVGFFLIALFLVALFLALKNTLHRYKWFLVIALISMPLAYIGSQSGWMIAEFGRQPWVIQNLMPTHTAVSNIQSGMVMTTFWIFAVVFTVLLIAEIKIMVNQVKKGPQIEEE